MKEYENIGTDNVLTTYNYGLSPNRKRPNAPFSVNADLASFFTNIFFPMKTKVEILFYVFFEFESVFRRFGRCINVCHTLNL